MSPDQHIDLTRQPFTTLLTKQRQVWSQSEPATEYCVDSTEDEPTTPASVLVHLVVALSGTTVGGGGGGDGGMGGL